MHRALCRAGEEPATRPVPVSALAVAQEAMWSVLPLHEIHDPTIDCYTRSLRRACREGLDLDAFLSSAPAAWRAGEEWRRTRANAPRTARRNDIRMLNALALVCEVRGWHEARIHWKTPKRAPSRRRALGQVDLDRLMAYAAEARPRDAAILEVALLTGAGRTELSRIRLEHLDSTGSRIYISGARGHASDWIPVEPELWRPDGPLATYLEWRRRQGPGALWLSTRRPHTPLAPPGIADALTRTGRLAGVALTANITRHTRGRRLWLAWRQEELVQVMLRQTTRSATPIYTEPGLEDARDRMTHGGPGLTGDLGPTCPTCKRAW